MKTVVNLDARKSDQTLQRAVRAHSQIVLEPLGERQGPINGYLISGDEQALLMEVTGQPRTDFAALIDSPCEVQLYSDQRYLFESTITAAPKWGESRSLALSRPRILKVLDRRRFARAKLASSSRVTLEWLRGHSTHHHVGSLLNISCDGLACRIDGGAASVLEVGTELRVDFKLPGHEAEFDLDAVVTNRTPASEGCVILGLQFVVSGAVAQQLTALRQALHAGPWVAVAPGLPA